MTQYEYDTLAQRAVWSGCSTLTFFVSEGNTPPFIPRHFVKSTSFPSSDPCYCKVSLGAVRDRRVQSVTAHEGMCMPALCVCGSHIVSIYVSNWFVISCVCLYVQECVCVVAEGICVRASYDILLPLSGFTPECSMNGWKSEAFFTEAPLHSLEQLLPKKHKITKQEVY